MDVILTSEGVWVLLFVIDALNLNRRMEKFVLAAEQVGHLSQGLEWLVRHDVTGHGHFTDRNGPHVQIVQFYDIAAALISNVLSELLNVD